MYRDSLVIRYSLFFTEEEDIYANISLYAFSSRLNALINSIFMLFHAHEYSRCNAMPLARTGFVH
jgi:hypothetical protein